MSSPLPQPFRFHLLQEYFHPFPQNESISFLRRKRKCATTVITSHIKHVVCHYVNALSSAVTINFSNNTKQNHQNNDNCNVIPIFNDKIISYHFRFVRWIFHNVWRPMWPNRKHTTHNLSLKSRLVSFDYTAASSFLLRTKNKLSFILLYTLFFFTNFNKKYFSKNTTINAHLHKKHKGNKQKWLCSQRINIIHHQNRVSAPLYYHNSNFETKKMNKFEINVHFSQNATSKQKHQPRFNIVVDTHRLSAEKTPRKTPRKSVTIDLDQNWLFNC